LVGYDKKIHEHIHICIELVMHYLPTKSNSKSDLEISVSHTTMPLADIVNKSGEHVLSLKGGDPSKPAEIKPEDVRTKRSGLSNIVS
jgi:hypothetical protein